jgi:hypothetical protein
MPTKRICPQGAFLVIYRFFYVKERGRIVLWRGFQAGMGKNKNLWRAFGLRHGDCLLNRIVCKDSPR